MYFVTEESETGASNEKNRLAEGRGGGESDSGYTMRLAPT